MAQIDLKKASIQINGGGGNITIRVGEGNLTYSERRNIEYVRDRGLLYGTREGDEEPVDVSLDLMWEYITGGGDKPLDVLKGAGDLAGTGADACEPYACDITVTYTETCAGGGTGTIVFPEFRYEELSFDMRAGTISCSGKCNVTQVNADF